MSEESGMVGNEKLTEKLRKLGKAVQGASLVKALKAGGLVFRNAIVINIQKQGLIRTRTLSRSVHEEVIEQSDTKAVLEEGTDLDYAAIHEFGGVIKAKNGKYLSIPIGSYTGSPTKYSDLKLRKTGGGTLILIDGSGLAQYVLKTSVEIPARPYIRPAFDEKKDEATREVGRAFIELIEKEVETK
jgi:phage gpG-like protein